MKAHKLALALICAASAPSAQDLMRSVEMPGHRSLMSVREASELMPFETDGCSGGLSTSWRLVADTFPKFGALHETIPPWEACCVTHDQAYHNAGGATDPGQSFDARLAADDELRTCVKEHGRDNAKQYAVRYDMTTDQIRAAYGTISEAMYLAVRFGGGPCTGLPWRWGFGYPGCSPFETVIPARE